MQFYSLYDRYQIVECLALEQPDRLKQAQPIRHLHAWERRRRRSFSASARTSATKTAAAAAKPFLWSGPTTATAFAVAITFAIAAAFGCGRKNRYCRVVLALLGFLAQDGIEHELYMWANTFGT
jgi:hypothetical protein